MSAVVRSLLALAFMVVADSALAHPALPGTRGFWGGLLHPFLVPAHVLAIAAAGLLMAQVVKAAPDAGRWSGPAAFAAGLMAGTVVIARAFVPAHANEVLLGLASVSGIWIAAGRPPLRLTYLLIAGLTGLAVALDSPPDAILLREAILMQIGTFCGALAFFTALQETAARLRRGWQVVGLRIVGSWTAASAILVLALRLAK
ncbi:MAG TPA: HupE/UreJ family protein [Xanthobacteraceae bacterium]|nr:HupE/UreJ family protein [Xanthobacteraceae bacterium]